MKAGGAAALASVLSAAAVLAGTSCGLVRARPRVAIELTHGVSVGEVGPDTAVLWGRCGADGFLRVAVVGEGGDGANRAVGAATDGTGVVRLENLDADRAYEARVWCSDERRGEVPVEAATASFRTAPPAGDARPVRFAWSGDLGGQNVCRDAREGYPIFAGLRAEQPDFFVALGDMIYADDPCREEGRYGNGQIPGPPPASDIETYRAHWRYNFADPHFQAFRAAVPYFPVWDDHEIRNDAGPLDGSAQSPDRPLLPIARRAFLDYQALSRSPQAPELYRSLRWGAHLELFFLDTRQYRAANAEPDVGTAPKSLLGAAQREWFERALTDSDATWKVVVSSVPLSIPTGAVGRRDGWASFDGDSGFAREARSLLRTARERGVRNLVWITTDVHFATGFRYVPFAEDPSFVVYELVCGPLNAGVFPNLAVDPTLHPERLYFWGPESIDAISSFAEAKRWFNYGVVDIDAEGNLSFRIVNGLGETVVRTRLPAARSPVASPRRDFD